VVTKKRAEVSWLRGANVDWTEQQTWEKHDNIFEISFTDKLHYSQSGNVMYIAYCIVVWFIIITSWR